MIGDEPYVPSRGEDEVSIYAILRILLQHRYLIVALALALGFLTAGSALIGSRSYTAESTFMPQGGGRATAGGLAALAGQFGVTVGPGEPTQSPQFYAELLEARGLLNRLIPDTFSVGADPRTERGPARGTLADLLQIEGETEALRRERTLRAVSRSIAVSTTGTGMVQLDVTTPWPELSQAVAQRLVELVNEFNLETRQINAAAESQFVEARLKESEANLRQAEDELRVFLESNRQFQNSPALMFEYDRLVREVQQQHQLHTGLQESLQNARIAQVRDTPLITVLNAPERPVHPDSRRVPLRAILGMLIGGMAGAFIAFFREFFGHRPSEADPQRRRFQKVWNETLRDLRLSRR